MQRHKPLSSVIFFNLGLHKNFSLINLVVCFNHTTNGNFVTPLLANAAYFPSADKNANRVSSSSLQQIRAAGRFVTKYGNC